METKRLLFGLLTLAVITSVMATVLPSQKKITKAEAGLINKQMKSHLN